MVTSQKLLVDESPLFVLPGLAKKLQPDLKTRAASATVLLQQIHYYLSLGMGRELKDGKRYIFYTQAEWRTKIPWLTEWDFREIVKELVNLGLLMVKAFNDHKRDRTGHYTINYNHEWLISLSPKLSTASDASKSDAVETVLNYTDTTPNRSSDISLPLPPQDPTDPEREKKSELEIPELTEDQWVDLQDKTNQERVQELEEYYSPLSVAPQETSIPTEDPWSEPPSEPSLNNDLTIKLGEEQESSPVGSTVVVDEIFYGDRKKLDNSDSTSQDQVVLDVEIPQPESKPGIGFAPPVRKQKPSTVPEAQQDWEIAPGVPYPAFVRWRSQHYVKQGGHWADAAQANAKSEIRNNPQRAADLWEQFLEYSNTATNTALARQASGMAPVLPSCFIDAIPASKDEVVSKLQTLAGVAQVVLPQSIATPSCAATTPWMPNNEAVEKVLAGTRSDSTTTTNNAPGAENAAAYAVFKADTLPEPTAPPEDFKAKTHELLKQMSMPKPTYAEPRNEIDEYRAWIESGNGELIAKAERKLGGMVGVELVHDANGRLCGFEL